MAKGSSAHAIYERVRDICSGFAGVDAKLSHGAPAFHVRGKMLLSFVDDHHGDGRVAVWVKSTKDEQRRLVGQDPDRYYVPPYVGVSGWVGVRLDRDPDWVDLAILVESAWLAVVPPSLRDKPREARKAPALRLPTTDAKVAKEALEKVTAICMALPEATIEREGSHATFRVRKKVFAYFLDNHHGDEIISVSVKAEKKKLAALVKADPKRLYLPQYIGPKGWLGVRLDVGRTNWKDVTARVRASYAAAAPKRLAEAVAS